MPYVLQPYAACITLVGICKSFQMLRQELEAHDQFVSNNSKQPFITCFFITV